MNWLKRIILEIQLLSNNNKVRFIYYYIAKMEMGRINKNSKFNIILEYNNKAWNIYKDDRGFYICNSLDDNISVIIASELVAKRANKNIKDILKYTLLPDVNKLEDVKKLNSFFKKLIFENSSITIKEMVD